MNIAQLIGLHKLRVFQPVSSPPCFAPRGDGQSDVPFDIDPQFTTLDLLASRAGCITLSHISATSRSLPRIAWL
jgi:hypothetical protein